MYPILKASWVLSRIGLKTNMKQVNGKTEAVRPSLSDSETICAGLTSDVLPEEKTSVLAEDSLKGVSTHCTHSATNSQASSSKETSHWYALRTTYGRERKAYDYMVAKGVKAFCPTLKVTKQVRGERREVIESRLPNIFFAHGTEEELKKFVFDNVNLPFLRFYYRHYHDSANRKKEPLIVPDDQIESLRIICEAEANDILLVPEDEPKFKSGQRVRVIDGKFKGVEGRVARYHGQQRVAVVIEDIATIATAYLPSAFLEFI